MITVSKERKYTIEKNKFDNKIVQLDSSKMDGFKVTPKNEITYEGVAVNSLLLMKPSFIVKVIGVVASVS